MVGEKLKEHACKKCNMKFSDEERLKRHFEMAHPNKRKFVDPKEYWYDSGAGV